jgi:DNA-binding FadR family transcriptional regulator
MKFETIKKVTVTEQIMDRIADLIVRGEIPAGTKLPNERDLAEQFGVARGRIREALRALSLIGLITIKPGEGSYVTYREQPLPAGTITWLFHDEIHNLEEVYEARKLIESAVYLSAAKHLNAEHLERLDGMLNAIAAHRDPKIADAAKFMNLLDQFDLYIGEICGNRIYGKLMQTIIHLRRDSSLKILQVPGAIENSIDTRSGLLDALKSGDTAKIKKAINHFFKSSEKFYQNIGRK